MKSIINLVLILNLIGIVTPRILFGDSIDEEVLVLFKAGTIIMPKGYISATLTEINAVPGILSVMRDIGVVKLTKAFPDFKETDTLRISAEGWIACLPDFSNLIILRLQNDADRDHAIYQLESLSNVIYAEKNQRAYPEYVPNDPYRMNQWYLGADYIAAYRAFDYSRGSNSTIIGIIDGGVDRYHDDLQGKVLGDIGYDSDHGTHVAGIAAAITDNDTGIVGIDWHAQIWAEKCINSGIQEIANAVINAVNNGCKILNNSWGINRYSPTLYSAFTYAYQMGAMPISSMSNSNSPHDYPKRFGPWMTNVGSSNMNNKWYSNSVTGYWIDVAAPGVSIYSTLPNDNYGYKTGTSMAAPVVSGIAGLLIAANPDLKNYDLEWVIKLTATDIEGSGFDDKTGYGRVNADTAVKHVTLPYQIARNDVPISLFRSNTWCSFLNYPLPGLSTGAYFCDIYKAECDIIFQYPYAETPFGWMNLTGFSGANPNNAYYWMVQDLTTSSVHLKTFFYFIKKDAALQTINRWAPVDPGLLSEGLRYSILGRKPIDAPSYLHARALAGGNDIRLGWIDNSDNELSFVIERRTNGTTFSYYDNVGQNVTEYIDDNTTEGQEYWYRVRAWAQEFHSGYSNVACAIAGLAKPSNVVAETEYPWNYVDLTWQDNTSIEHGFEIWRSGIDESSHLLVTLPANTIEYTDNDKIKPFYDYTYQVRAFRMVSDREYYYSEFSYPPAYVTTSPIFERPPWGFTDKSRIAYGNDKYHLVTAWNDKLLYTYSTDGKSWSDYETVSDESGTQVPSIAVTSEGDVAVTWISDTYYYEYILYRIRNGEEWGSIDTIVALGTHLQNHTDMIISNNTIYITWSEKGTGSPYWEKVYLASFPYNNPSSAEIEYITTLNYYHPDYSAEPKVTIYQNTPHLVWQEPPHQNVDAKIYHSYKYSATGEWSEPVEVVNDVGYPSVTVFQDTVYLVGHGIGGVVIYSFAWLDGEWIARANLGTGGGNKHPLITSNTDNLYIVMQPSYPQEIRYFQYRQGEFEDLGTIMLGDLYPKLHSITLERRYLSSGEYLAIVYKDNKGDPCRHVFKKRPVLQGAGPRVEKVKEGGSSGPQGNEMQYTGPFRFETIYPNPAKGVMKIRFMSPDQRKITVKLYDVTGRMINNLFDGNAKIGLNEIPFTPEGLVSGVYFVRVKTDEKLITEKVIFQR